MAADNHGMPTVVLAAATLATAVSMSVMGSAAGATSQSGTAALRTTIPPATAQLSSDAPPLTGREKVRETGYVARVTDGDTFRLATAPNRKTKNYTVVRLIGVQAPEVSRHRMVGGECGGDIAQAELAAFAEGKRVVLASKFNSRDHKRDRVLRTAYVRNSDGSWTDLAAYMLRIGWGHWFPKKREPLHNLQYRQITEEAAQRQVNMWDPQQCGTRHAPGMPVEIWVQSDPSGNDLENVNGEYVAIANPGVETLDISRWTVRDGALEWFRIPDNTYIGPGGTFKVHVGKGQNRANAAYWGWNRPIFTNAEKATKDYMGDGAYLLDPQGNVRAHFTYPCLSGCADPRSGVIAFKNIRFDPPGHEIPHPNRERLRIVNTGSEPVSLTGTELRIGGYTYEFDYGDVIAPKGSVTVYMGKRPPNKAAGLVQSGKPRSYTWFGAPHAILDNGGDIVRIKTLSGTTIACAGWRAYRNACRK
jgi:endonuclease YncB( thermonuclease family)